MDVPKHVGIILDGNRRWAKLRNLQPWDGHKAGAKTLSEIIKAAYQNGIKILTVYVWSLKNEQSRNEIERRTVFQLGKEYFKTFSKDIKDKDIRLNILGRWEQSPLKDFLKKAMDSTKNNKGMTLNFCFMYDGRAEIVDACQKIINEGLKEVDEETLKEHMYTGEFESPELIIRTGMDDGCRLSGFLLWDSSYAEFIFHNILWPDYTPEQLKKDLEEFSKRNRRFGK